MAHAVATGSRSKEESSAADRTTDMDPNTLRDLLLRSKQLTHLSDELRSCLSNLKKLDLSNGKLATLPHPLQHATHLIDLMANQNYLSTVPLTMTQTLSLRELQLSGNGMTSLPDNLGDLKGLETLNLSCNRLKTLPESCVNLDKLKNLDLSGNDFKSLPNCLTRGMRALETLDVSRNMYINVTTAPATLKLKELYVRQAGRNVIFPGWVLKRRAPNLQVLDCDGTIFKYIDFPNNCPSLKLRILSLDSCNVYEKFIREITSRTDKLETLRLGNIAGKRNRNTLWNFPIKHLNLNNPLLLTEISVRDTGLSNMGHEIGNFRNLVKLDLSLNNISWLPDDICLLSKLEVLLVDGNYLSALPNDIGRMTSLRELKAVRNCLATLPKSIRDLKHLLYLDLYDNEFSEAPEELSFIPNLLGTDFEHNYFNTKDLCIRDLQYVALRRVLRDRYESPDDQRINGPRYESGADELVDAIYKTNWDSDKSSITSDEPNSTVDREEEENWDTDNSADEFDPTCANDQPRREKFISVLPRKIGFCPADYHSLPVKWQVAQKRQKGEIQDQFYVEEGQFDDA